MSQVMRIATFHTKPDVDEARHDAFKDWLATQPGAGAVYHVTDPATGHYLSISVWDSREAMLALRDRVPPGGPLGLKPDAVATYDVESIRNAAR